MSLLKMTRPRRDRDVIKFSPLDIFEHQVGNEHLEGHAAGAEIDVEKAVVVDVGAVAAHHRHLAVQPDLHGDIAKTVGPEIAIEPGTGCFLVRHFRGGGHEVRERTGEVAHVEVEPAVVVVIPEPARKRILRSRHFQFGRDVAEGAVPLVVIEARGNAHIGDEQIESPVAVVIAPGRSLGPLVLDGSARGDAGRRGHIDELAVTLVVIQPTALILAADEQIDETVVVVVTPRGGFRRDRLGQTAGNRDIFKRAVPRVSQQRHAHRLFPAAPQQQGVQMAIVVEVGTNHVQRVDLIGEPRLVGLVLERAVSAVDKQ